MKAMKSTRNYFHCSMYKHRFWNGQIKRYDNDIHRKSASIKVGPFWYFVGFVLKCCFLWECQAPLGPVSTLIVTTEAVSAFTLYLRKLAVDWSVDGC